MENFAISLCKQRSNEEFYKLLKKMGRGAFDTKITRYSYKILLAFLEKVNLHSKCMEKIVGAIHTECISNSYENIIWGIKLLEKNAINGRFSYRIHKLFLQR